MNSKEFTGLHSAIYRRGGAGGRKEIQGPGAGAGGVARPREKRHRLRLAEQKGILLVAGGTVI